ncbi:CYFA0S07e03686g1_1 [Cyberlindnera fabianii]|uniref:CYFA0S07e03686g1_1 n=1 Tax=Cyberlindnera fabianii TaxID=36022 RepID=A0A061B3J7_CYBFA|nr:CYFA0S07e03686g1_1 [Cyberlindnera fabianii]
MNVTIVTGASRGIGACITDILLKDPKSHVVAVARSEEPLRCLRIKYGEERVVTVQGDLAEEETVKQIISTCIERFGRIDNIIANAGVLEPVEQISLANIPAWKKLFDINFFSIVSLVAQALPYVKQSKGNVILVSSGASTKAYYGWGAYGTSKAAINQFALQLASEETDVKCVAVAPGVVDTQMQEDIRDKFGKNMTPEGHKRFTDLKRNQELLDPIVPATIYANLAIKGINANINGKYLRYNDDALAEYSK